MGEGGCLCQWELKAPTDRSRSDCVHEQVAKRIANVRFTVQFDFDLLFINKILSFAIGGNPLPSGGGRSLVNL